MNDVTDDKTFNAPGFSSLFETLSGLSSNTNEIIFIITLFDTLSGLRQTSSSSQCQNTFWSCRLILYLPSDTVLAI